MIDLNSWYEQYRKNTDRVRFEMVQSAAREYQRQERRKSMQIVAISALEFVLEQ